jgi:hypothetical protein
MHPQHAVGVRAVDARDALGRYRFHALSPTYHLNDEDKNLWFHAYTLHKIKQVERAFINLYFIFNEK